jgi:DNA-binding NarL/FixJ family response regulator
MTAANLVIVEDRPLVQQRLHDLFATNPEFVLRALCTNAEDLGVSPNTVRVHIARIYEKLESSNKVQALNRARQLRLLD